MKNVYVIRHCKAEGQASDARLTELGQRQAEQLTEFLLNKQIDLMLSSPFERAHRSIAPLAEKLGIEVVLDDRLAERVLSTENHPEWRKRLLHTFEDLDACYEGGESSRSVMDRAVAVVREALDSQFNSIAIVSHGNLISLLLKHFDERIGFEEWSAMSNPDVFRLSFVGDVPEIERIWNANLG